MNWTHRFDSARATSGSNAQGARDRVEVGAYVGGGPCTVRPLASTATEAASGLPVGTRCQLYAPSGALSELRPGDRVRARLRFDPASESVYVVETPPKPHRAGSALDHDSLAMVREAYAD